MPSVTILAGPNGAGKTTVKPRLIPDTVTFLNADDIARDLGGDPNPARDLAAGRFLLRRMAELERTGTDFAIETNLANRTLAVRIPKWQAAGYRVSLFFVWLPADDLAVLRVAQRVRAGGHNIPEETIRRRYNVGLHNLFNVYIPLVNRWRVYDNSSPEGQRFIAGGRQRIVLPDQWAAIRQGAAIKSVWEE